MDAKAKVVDVLRERYAPTEVPPCRVCGGPLSLAAIGGGKPTVWACSGNEDDPDRPGYIRSQPGRWGNAKDGVSEYGPGGHYHDSRWVDRRQGGDSQVIELIEDYERLLTGLEALAGEWEGIGSYTHHVADDYKAGQMYAFNVAFKQLRTLTNSAKGD